MKSKTTPKTPAPKNKVKSPAKKSTYVLDTCVLISDPQAYKSFRQSDVVIPITVLDELDKLKMGAAEVSRNARLCIRYLDELCAKGELHIGIDLENGINLRVDTSATPNSLGSDAKMDNKILTCAMNLGQMVPAKNVILVSKDINLRIRGRSYGLKVQDYSKTAGKTEELYSGLATITNEDVGYALHDKEWYDLKGTKLNESLFPNQCVHVLDNAGNSMGLARKIESKSEVRLKKISDRKVWGLDSKSKEQALALDMLMDTKIPLVTLVGKAGTGKTLISLAAALELVLSQKKYSKIVLLKPMNPTDKNQELGFLPGDKQLKLQENYASYFDAFEYLFTNGKNAGTDWQRTLDMYMERGQVQMEALAFLRGRTLSNAVVILDEAQSLPPKMIKTVLTRLGANSKMIVLGDPMQRDSDLDFDNNALTVTVETEKFKTSNLTGHLVLTKTERGPLAELVADIL